MNARLLSRLVGRLPGRLVGRLPALALVGAVVGSMALAGCTVSGTLSEFKNWEATFDEGIGQAPHVVVETFNGRIHVTAADTDGSVVARVTSRGSGTSGAAALADLDKVQVTFVRDGIDVIITARRTDRPAVLGNSGADVDVTVPAASSLDLRTSNGRVETANVRGAIKAITSNGAVTTRGGRDLEIDTTNAQVTVNNPSGRVAVRTSNGALDIIAADRATVTAQTSNAPITFAGSLAPDDHMFRTSNGDLTLNLPGNQRFAIDGTTSNGTVSTDFVDDLVTRNTVISGRTGFINVASITASTSNGNLRVMQLRP
jgi:DUF4097 and DUF4098 domain-containing protein YvlB